MQDLEKFEDVMMKLCRLVFVISLKTSSDFPIVKLKLIL